MKRQNEVGTNLQTKQPFINQPKPNDGWSEPLADTSNPITYKYTVGRSGSVEGRKVNAIENEKTDTEKDEG